MLTIDIRGQPLEHHHAAHATFAEAAPRRRVGLALGAGEVPSIVRVAVHRETGILQASNHEIGGLLARKVKVERRWGLTLEKLQRQTPQPSSSIVFCRAWQALVAAPVDAYSTSTCTRAC